MGKQVSRRQFVKFGAGIAAAGFGASLYGCGGSSTTGSASNEALSALDFDPSDWDAVLSAAKGKTVTYYGWGQNSVLNTWLEGDFAKTLKDKYDLGFEYVQVTNTAEIITMLTDEVQAGKKAGEGVCDVAWVNGENFAQCKQNGTLWGDYVQYLPNMKYYDKSSVGVTSDDGFEIEGMESLFGTTVNALIYDSAKLQRDEVPTNAKAFLEFVKAHPGKVTWPALPEYQCTRVLETFIMDIQGTDCFSKFTESTTYDEMKEALSEGLAFLREMTPYFWNEGKTYPAKNADCMQMFANGEIYFYYSNSWIKGTIEAGTIPATSRSIAMDNNLIAHHYLTIPQDCPNFAGALVMANEWLDPECAAQRCPAGYVPATDCMVMDTLSDSQKKTLDAAMEDGGQYADSMDVFSSHAVAYCPSVAIETFEEVLQQEVMGKTN